ncbi:MAG: hypothetical protein ACRDYA_03685 [Egibacteraceae bacterium]
MELWPSTATAEVALGAAAGSSEDGGEAGGALDPRSTRSGRFLLACYVDALERYAIPALVGLLREDAILSMPPYGVCSKVCGTRAARAIGCQDGR